MSVQLPSNQQALGETSGAWTRPWYEWAWQVTQQANRNLGSGATTGRPSTQVVGAVYFDTTLGRPIWWDGSAWVYADGTPA